MNSLLSWRPAALPDSWADHHGWTSSWLLPLLVIGVIAGFVALESSLGARLPTRAAKALRRALVAVLAASALLAVMTYLDFGVFRYGTYLNEWDFYHYYVGTKYAPELGYTKLYGATLLADAETGLRYRPADHLIRDLRTAEMRDMGSVADEANHYRAGFTPTRWREFVADVAWFKSQLPAPRWSLLLADHGFNGTPAWSFVVGGLLTRHLSVRAAWSRWLMLLLDPALLLVGVLAVAWAFDTRLALLMVVFVGTHYLFSWGHLKGALLRTDYAMAPLLAVCLVKRERYKLAGGLLGWAVLSRIFPMFLLLGPVVLLVHRRWCTRRWDPGLVALLATSAATMAVIVAGSCAYFGGAHIWREWSDKIALHYAGGSDWDLGLRSILEASFHEGVPVRRASVALATGQDPTAIGSPLVLATIVLLALPAIAFVPALKSHEAVAYGFVFVFLFSNATYYYYLVLCLPLLFLAAPLERPGQAMGTAYLFLTGALGFMLFSGFGPLRQSWVVMRGWHQNYPTYYFMSCLIAVTVAHMIAVAGLRARATEKQINRQIGAPTRS